MEETENYPYCFEKNLWGNYEYLHIRRSKNNECFNSLIHLFEKINKAKEGYIKAVNLTEIKNSLKNIDENDFIVQSFKCFISYIEMQIQQLDLNIKVTKNNIIEYIKTIKSEEQKNELSYYNDLQKSYSNYTNAKNSSNKYKEKYYKSVKILIDSLDQSQKGNQFHDLFFSKKKNVKSNLETYKTSINDANKFLAEFKSKQKEILKNYEKAEIRESELLVAVLKNYLELQKTHNNIYREQIKKFEDQLSPLNKIKFSDIEKMTNISTKFSTYDEKELSFIDYDLKMSMGVNSIDDRKHYIQKIKEVQNLIEGIFSNIDLELENKICELEELLMKYIGEENEITDDIMNKIKEFTNDPATHMNFILVLNKIRCNGNFQKSEYIIKNLGDIFNKILNTAEKNNDYDTAQNCLILSQTFYFQNSNNEKIYVKEYIKNNEWLKTPDFWKLMIEKKIDEELNKFKNGFEVMLENEKDNRLKSKFSTLVFSHILTFGKNMVMFIKEKEVIKQVLNELIKKHSLNEEQAEFIFNIVFSEQNNEETEKDSKNENKEKIKEYENGETINKNTDDNKEDKINDKNEDNKNDNKVNNEEDKKDVKKDDNLEEKKENKEDNKKDENKENNINDL